MSDIPQNPQIHQLPVHERAAAVLLILVVLIFIAANLYLDQGEIPKNTGEPVLLATPYIEVTIAGAVARPGVYQVVKGATVGEVLDLAGPLDRANLKTIKKDSKILRRRKIIVRELP